MKKMTDNQTQAAVEGVHSIRHSLVGIMFWLIAIVGVGFVTNQIVHFFLGS